MDINWRPKRQWRWTVTGMIFGYFAGNILGVSLEINSFAFGVLFMALGGILLWFARFYEANFHDD